MSVTIVATLLAATTACGPPAAIAGVELHGSPFESLQHIDLGLSMSSRRTLKTAAFLLTGCAVISALREQADARMRLLFDVGELEESRPCTPGHPPGKRRVPPTLKSRSSRRRRGCT